MKLTKKCRNNFISIYYDIKDLIFPFPTPVIKGVKGKIISKAPAPAAEDCSSDANDAAEVVPSTTLSGWLQKKSGNKYKLSMQVHPRIPSFVLASNKLIELLNPPLLLDERIVL